MAAYAPKPEQPIVGVVWRRRGIVLLCTFAALAIGGIYLLLAPPSYTSTAEVYIDQGRDRGIISQSPSDLERSDDYLNTQCELMISTPILAMALSEDGISGLQMLRGVGDPIEYLQKNLNAEVGKKSELIYVSLEAHNGVEAASVVNAVVQAYVTYQTKMQHSTSAEVLEILQKEKSHDELAIAVKDRELAALRDMYGQTAYDSRPEQSDRAAGNGAFQRADRGKARCRQCQGRVRPGDRPDRQRSAEA